jgi:hypothetical protein
MPEPDFREFLARSFELMRDEVPGAYAAVCRVLDSRDVRVEVDRQSVAVGFARGEARLTRSSERRAVDVRTTRDAILALVDARETLLEAVLSERVAMTGSTHDLLAFYDGLMAYVHGAVRAPSFPALLRAYRGT